MSPIVVTHPGPFIGEAKNEASNHSSPPLLPLLTGCLWYKLWDVALFTFRSLGIFWCTSKTSQLSLVMLWLCICFFFSDDDNWQPWECRQATCGLAVKRITKPMRLLTSSNCFSTSDGLPSGNFTQKPPPWFWMMFLNMSYQVTSQESTSPLWEDLSAAPPTWIWAFTGFSRILGEATRSSPIINPGVHGEKLNIRERWYKRWNLAIYIKNNS